MNGKDLRIVFMGTPDFAVTPLRRLAEDGYNIVAVVTMPDKPSGRGLKMQESAVKRYAVQAGIPVLQPEKLKNEAFVMQFRALDADLGIVIAFRMLPEVIWTAPRLGTFNLHASLLPQYRGAAPINWAIINGETQTGLTTFLLNHEIDKGAIIARQKVAITDDDTAGTLHDKLMYAGEGLVVEVVEKIASGNISPIEQASIEPEALKAAPKIFKDDCRVDWAKDAATVRNLVRGLSPYPAAWSLLHNHTTGEEVPVKIFSAHIGGPATDAPGTIVSDGKKEICVSCASCSLTIDELQPAGKKRMSAEEWLCGFKNISDWDFK